MNDLKVAMVQTDLYWENTDANLAMLEEKIWQITDQPDLILLPEMFTTGFSMQTEKLAEPVNFKTFRWMKQMAAQTNATIMGSYIVQDAGQYHNRLYAVSPNGSSSYYDKRHLFALAGEDAGYSPGTQKVIVDVKGWKVMPLICYDLRFPVWSRSQKQGDSLYQYDLVVYLANWPKPRIKSWDTLLAARAIENNAYSIGVNRMGKDGVGATYVGHSAAYNYLGERLAYSEKEEIINIELYYEALRKYRAKFPFQADGDDFTIIP